LVAEILHEHSLNPDIIVHDKYASSPDGAECHRRVLWLLRIVTKSHQLLRPSRSCVINIQSTAAHGKIHGSEGMLAVSNIHEIAQPLVHQSIDFAPLFLRQATETATAGSTIFFDGDAARHVFSIVSGNVRICRFLPDGRRLIIGFLGTGDLVGLSFRNRYMFSAEAIDEVVFSRMGKRMLEAELQLVPEFRSQLLSHLRDEISAGQDHMLLLSHKNAQQRVCSFLLQRLEKTQSPDGRTIHLPMVRADIADHLGMTIETVSRTLTKLVAKGVLLPAEKHQFKVISRSELARSADEYAEDAVEGGGAGDRHAGRRYQ
jgi:CRP/FNR family transcriptional regulator